ncbi:tetratricopeptide repeat-containing sulfotransferase family protein [Phenylobacterium aquaticum]|uniref:tetratricopeptide repeat-containing sulfotransferase family protein n=1 Tax=Phenylobacterium aquaticum TaxID=1763816 RepID=UPI001F5D0412|nr:sulfotransferase [Phenylobacterium aquaticum]MCI3131067.1 sulfotransferase [Phenylobacterium aquaticum]
MTAPGAPRSVSHAAPGDGRGGLEAVRALVNVGRRGEANAELLALEPGLQGDARGLQAAGEVFLANARFDDALRCYRRAADLAPRDPGVLYNLASVLVACGDLVGAEHAYDQVVALDPLDGDACYNRATLRKWGTVDNHIDQMTAAVARVRQPGAEAALCYALAKEYEDLGDASAAWTWLARGAARRRSLLSYKVEADLATMTQIAQVFDAPTTACAATRPASAGPVFVLGLPRSGTTLVDRILSAHSQVESLGEISDFALSLVRTVGPAVDKGDMVARSGRMDFERLGQAYRDSLTAYGRAAPMVIDKTPANYLYIGLIALSLPEARIVHVRRDPMDNGYALFKTLFRTGCPYSYSQADLGQYIGAYHRLMAHWRDVLRGRMVEIDYEALVEDQAGESRRLVEVLGLTWEPACLDFHANPAPAATASAAQVRRPIYRDSLSLWRRYEAELAPLAQSLKAQGVA